MDVIGMCSAAMKKRRKDCAGDDDAGGKLRWAPSTSCEKSHCDCLNCPIAAALAAKRWGAALDQLELQLLNSGFDGRAERQWGQLASSLSCGPE
jgi:hypothetical protein